MSFRRGCPVRIPCSLLVRGGGRLLSRRWGSLVLIAAMMLAACAGGEKQLTPLEALIEETDSRFNIMIDRGREDDIDGVEKAFLEVLADVGQLDTMMAARPKEVISRADLLDVVTRIELELENERRPDLLADIAEDGRRALEEVAEALKSSQVQE